MSRAVSPGNNPTTSTLSDVLIAGRLIAGSMLILRKAEPPPGVVVEQGDEEGQGSVGLHSHPPTFT